VQFDNGEIILTDLESTNGTRVNGSVIQIRRLKAGDRVGVGRSLLLFGSAEEIAARQAELVAAAGGTPTAGGAGSALPATVHANVLAAQLAAEDDYALNPGDKITLINGALFLGGRPLPPLPQKMSPSQAARLAELLDFLHRHLSAAVENIRANDDATQVTLSFADWQRVMAVQMVLARYTRAVAEPDALGE
jgi:hypothetical protein